MESTPQQAPSEASGKFARYNRVSCSAVAHQVAAQCRRIGAPLPAVRATVLALIERRRRIKELTKTLCKGKLRRQFWRTKLLADRKQTFPLVA